MLSNSVHVGPELLSPRGWNGEFFGEFAHPLISPSSSTSLDTVADIIRRMQADDEGTVVPDDHFGVGFLYPRTCHSISCFAPADGNIGLDRAYVTSPKAPGFIC